MKKIAVICNYKLMSDRVGGMDYYFWLFDDECKKAGYEITWFFPNSETHGSYQNMSIIYAHGKSLEHTFIDYIKEGNKVNILFCHFLELCTTFYKNIKKVSRIKIIAIDHNPRPIGGYPFRKKLEKRLKGQLYSKYIDSFIAVSNYTKFELLNDFGEHIKNKVQVIYNGIDTSKILVRNQQPTATPRFLTACHLRESKGIQDLIIAIDKLPNQHKQKVKIDIYGDGPYQHKLEHLIKKLNLKNNFCFKGNANNLYEIYCNYDYLIHPSHMECFSLGILEALAANVPVITTKVGGNKEVVIDKKNGRLIEPKNTLALSNVIKQTIDSNSIMESDTSTYIRKHFSIQKMVESYLKLI